MTPLPMRSTGYRVLLFLLLVGWLWQPPAGARWLPSAGALPAAEVWFDDLVAEDAPCSLLALSLGGPNATARVHFAGDRDAAACALELERVSAGEPATRTPEWRKLERVTEVRPAGAEPFVLEQGLDGVAFPRDTGLAFLPGEVLARGLVDPMGRWRPERARAYLAERGRTLPDGIHPAFLFRTEAMVGPGDRAVPLYREHRWFTELDSDLLLEAARAGGRYLARATDSDGRFVYSWLPGADRSADGYNIVRHAGTIHAMLELLSVEDDPDLRAAVERAIGYLLRHSLESSTDRAVIVEDGQVKLGGVALAVVALAKSAEVTGSREHVPTMLNLGRFIAAAQREDGEFFPHTILWPSAEAKAFTSEYYPGEAILALLRIHPFDPDGPWLDLAERGARWLIEVRDAGRAVDRLAHDHWLLYGLRELLRHRPRDLYRDHAMKIADAIVAAQKVDDALRPDWRGGWYEPPRSTPAATRSEGLVCALEIARIAGDAERAKRIERALRLALAFQLTTQFRPENAMHLKSPWRALGGFRCSLTDDEIRIDFVQHNISALLGFRRSLAD